jgi:CheY-like chemotaxis protein
VKVSTILVVDDEPDMRLYLQGCLSALESVGMVLQAADGVEALQLLESTHIDLVITDVVLPHVSGRELLKAIRSDPAREHIAVLLISGQEQARPAAGPLDGWLPKPFNARQLLRAVEKLLGPDPPSPRETGSASSR